VRPLGHHLPHSWVSGKVRSKVRKVGREYRRDREIGEDI